ncbi:MAG: hypothetical protein ABI548_11660 [Polyangiaceae bacterium]
MKESPVEISEDHTHCRVAENAAKPLIAFPKRFLHAHAIGDVYTAASEAQRSSS